MSLKTCISRGDKLLICDEIIFLVEKAYLKIVYKELRDGMVTSLTAQLNFNAYFFYDTNAKNLQLAISCCLGYKDARISV